MSVDLQLRSLPRTGIVLCAALLAAGIVSVLMLRSSAHTPELPLRVPGQDGRVAVETLGRQCDARTGGKLYPGDGTPSDLVGSWPAFRGVRRDGIADSASLPRTWNEHALQERWAVDVGEGYAGVAIRDGCVFLLDYDRDEQMDALRCLSLDDGREIWRYAYPVAVKRNHGMSRTVPAVDDEVVVSLGPKCHVVCIDKVTGLRRWFIDLVGEYGTIVPPWYAGQCPLLDDGKAIIAPAGTALMIAVDTETGERIWETPNPRGWNMTHASIAPMTFAGRKQYLYAGSGGVAAVAADDGSLLWDTVAWKIQIATVPSPVPLDDGRIFLSGGYDAGSMMLQLTETAEGIHPEPLYRLSPDVFGATQHTPILYRSHLYGIRPDGQLTCLALDGSPVWASGAADRFGLGPFLIADGALFALDDDGLLSVCEASSEGYRRLLRKQVLHGHDAWAPMAFAANRLIVRDLTRMVCLEILGGSS